MLATEEDILAQAESWKRAGKGVAIATITFASPLPAYAQRVDQADHTQTLASALEPPVSDGWKAPLVLPDTARSTPAEVPVICEVDRTGDILAC